VELLNTGTASVALESMVLKIDTVVLPSAPGRAGCTGGRVPIRFDGRASVEVSVAHAAPSFGQTRRAGLSLLRNDDFVLDQIAGVAPGAIQVKTGGRASSRVDAGSSFGGRREQTTLAHPASGLSTRSIR
jgi:hypothetical protein